MSVLEDPASATTARQSPRQLLVFADDWGRHPSSCQHLVRQLLPQLPTLWINTIGTRKPRLDLATLRRGWEKLQAWGKRGQGAGDRGQPEVSSASPGATGVSPVLGSGNSANLVPNATSRLFITGDPASKLRVVSPLMWPYFTRAHDRWLNRRLLTRAITPLLTNAAHTTAITTLPITADLVGALPCAKWIYYCVDDFSQWPGLDGQTLEQMERDLVARVDGVVAASAVLQDRLRSLGRSEVPLLTHGVDLEHWQSAGASGAELWPELPRPWIVFWGLIDRRLDVAWLKALGEQLQQGTILLVGPTQDPDPQLAELPRVTLRPALAFDELPVLAREASVLVMPYADLPVTRAMQPLKLLEYLATGKPVVVRDLPAVAEWRDALDACNDGGDFVQTTLARLEIGLPGAQEHARARLAEHSWRAKASELLRWL